VKLNVNGGRWLGVLALLWFIGAQWYWVRSNESSVLYYSLLMRVPEFLLGVAVAFASKNEKSQYDKISSSIGFILIFTSLIYIDEARFSPLSASIVCVGVALVLYSNVSNGLIASILNARALLLIGAMSYSIYLWHWPILAFWRYSLGEIEWGFGSVISYVLVVAALGWLSWFYVEERFRRVPIGKPAIARVFVLLVLVGVLPAAYSKALNALIPSAHLGLTRYADGSTICHSQVLSTCIRGVANNPKALLIGDSHAAQLNISAQLAGEKLGVGIEVLTASSCVPITGFNFAKLPQFAQQACKDQIAHVVPKIDQSKVVLLAAMWSYQFEDPLFESVVRKFLMQAIKDQKELLVVRLFMFLQVYLLA
jgi:hypothetical protein